MPNKKPKPVETYSYDKVVKNKNKKGFPIFFKYVGKKKVRVSRDEYRKVLRTKEYFKKKDKKNWKQNYKAAVRTLRDTVKIQEQETKKQKKATKKELESFELVPKKGRQTFANSMPTDIETQILEHGKGELVFKKWFIKIDNNNLLNVRLFFTELADVFYDQWHKADEAGKKVNSPQILYLWYSKLFKDNSIVTYIPLDRTTFSFNSKYFFDLINDVLLKKYFGD